MSTGPEAANKTVDEDILSFSALTRGDQRVLETENPDARRVAELLRTQAIMLNETHDAIMVRDREDHILFWNNGAERLYGWSANEAIGKNIYELLSLTSITEDPVSFAENGKCTTEMRQVTKDSRQIIVESRSRVLRDETGHPKSVLIVNTDVTEKRLIESQFLRAQRMETIGRLASGIAHDLNKVLSPVLLATSMLREKKMAREDRLWLDTLKINAEHAGGLINQLMSLARGIEGERTPIQLRHLIQETVGVLKRVFPESISIKTRIATDLWTIVGNATHVYQVLVNLCVNARDAMPRGGALTIEAHNTAFGGAPSSDYGDDKGGRHVLIKISDTGAGIPAEIIDKVFEPFFSTKHAKNGTGLGLSTVLRIVTSHKGVITVSSEPGKGTEFKMFFPVEDSASASNVEASEELPAAQPRGISAENAHRETVVSTKNEEVLGINPSKQ
ncbi:MAG TPA: ATP-binding protein [Candidatus Binatia bacterium]|nr:ATP-binding protein [Candidatus Binatia bacterium]